MRRQDAKAVQDAKERLLVALEDAAEDAGPIQRAMALLGLEKDLESSVVVAALDTLRTPGAAAETHLRNTVIRLLALMEIKNTLR